MLKPLPLGVVDASMVMTVWKVAKLVGSSLQSVHASEAEIRHAHELEGLRVGLRRLSVWSVLRYRT